MTTDSNEDKNQVLGHCNIFRLLSPYNLAHLGGLACTWHVRGTSLTRARCRLTRLTHLELDGVCEECWHAVDSIRIPDSLVDLRLHQPILSPSALTHVLDTMSPLCHLTLRRCDDLGHPPRDNHCFDVGLAPHLRYGLSKCQIISSCDMPHENSALHLM